MNLAMSKFYLLLSAIGLGAIALSYGLVPGTLLPMVLDFTIESVDLTHIFRGVMGLYLGMVLFWITAALKPALTRAGVLSVIFFMAGLGLGRVLSLLIEGMPSPLLLVYLGLEAAMAALGLFVLKKSALRSDFDIK